MGNSAKRGVCKLVRLFGPCALCIFRLRATNLSYLMLRPGKSHKAGRSGEREGEVSSQPALDEPGSGFCVGGGDVAHPA